MTQYLLLLLLYRPVVFGRVSSSLRFPTLGVGWRRTRARARIMGGARTPLSLVTVCENRCWATIHFAKAFYIVTFKGNTCALTCENV